MKCKMIYGVDVQCLYKVFRVLFYFKLLYLYFMKFLFLNWISFILAIFEFEFNKILSPIENFEYERVY